MQTPVTRLRKRLLLLQPPKMFPAECLRCVLVDAARAIDADALQLVESSIMSNLKAGGQCVQLWAVHMMSLNAPLIALFLQADSTREKAVASSSPQSQNVTFFHYVSGCITASTSHESR